jgi:diguanylate cyclase (GGDEF)-like protein/PAS domain S-box-containing protein
MTPPPGNASDPTPMNAWRRLQVSLMPDYNRKAAAYWWTVVTLGVLTVIVSVWRLSDLSPEAWAQIAIGAVIAMLAGVFPVRIPRSKNSFAAGEIFIFLLLLIHGPGAAALAAAGEAFVGSYRSSKRWTSRLASPAMSAVAMLSSGTALHLLLGEVGQFAGGVILGTMFFSLVYFVINSLMVTAVGRLKRDEGLLTSDIFALFGWVGFAYAGSAAVASLLFLVYLQSGIGVLMAMVPALAMMLATLHYFFRQQEAAEAVRMAGAEAAEREKELAQRHVRELEASERRFHSAFTHASIGMALLAFDGRILQANPALRMLLGREEDVLVQMCFQDVVVASDRSDLERQLGLANDHEFEGFALELRCAHAQGQPVWVAAHCSFFSEPGAGSPCLILQVQDITARRNAEEGLHHLAFHDSLTGLPNRRRFHELLAQAVTRLNASADPNDAYAVMFLDFDRFKLINDSLGHSAGDEFLVQVSQRIRDSLRPHDTVARLGGDEFAVLVRHVEHERSAVHLAERLMEAMRRPFLVAGTELMTSASIGITFSALGYTNPEDVLRDADTAMYKAKGAGKARYALFDASLHTEVAQRLRLEGQLRHAIDEGRLSVAYQPVFDLNATPGRSGIAGVRLAGFEALVRWQHPQDGTLSPGAFLPIAEEAGLMLKLTDFVLHCAARQLNEWHQLHPTWADLTMNVNVSGHDISHPAFVARVTRAIVEGGLKPAHLCIELTENILMSRLEGALPQLTELRRMGVTLAIDDFGTGYSSLSHLSTLPIDCLKIDRSFVSRLETGSNESAVVRSIMLLGTSLGKAVVAEGIETEQQLRLLQEMGCALGQGYLLARPLKAPEVGKLLRQLRPDAIDTDAQDEAEVAQAAGSGRAAAFPAVTIH